MFNSQSAQSSQVLCDTEETVACFKMIISQTQHLNDPLKSFTSLFSLLWWPTRGSSVILYRFKLWLLIHWQTQSTKLTKSTLISSVFSLIICRSCFHWRPDVCEFNLHFISLEEMRFWDLLLDRRPAMKMCFISFCEKLKQSVLQMMKMCLQTSRQFV